MPKLTPTLNAETRYVMSLLPAWRATGVRIILTLVYLRGIIDAHRHATRIIRRNREFMLAATTRQARERRLQIVFEKAGPRPRPQPFTDRCNRALAWLSKPAVGKPIPPEVQQARQERQARHDTTSP